MHAEPVKCSPRVNAAPVCGRCEVLREKRDSKCCPEFECGTWQHYITPVILAWFIHQCVCDFVVCDLVNCDLPEVPSCEDGQTAVLKNPGECQPIHECGKTFKMIYLAYYGSLHTHRTVEATKMRALSHPSFPYISLQKRGVCPSASP